MSEKELIEKYCKNCKNNINGQAQWMCFDCFYDMRFFKDKRFIEVKIPMSEKEGSIEKEGYIIHYRLEVKE